MTTDRTDAVERSGATATESDVRDITDLYHEFGEDRVPAGQRETSAFPVLSKSGTPDWDPDSWEFTVTGAVETERTFSWDEFRDLPHETQKQDFHCVTGWSKLDCAFTGVPFTELAERAGVTDDAVHVMFSALDGYTTDLPLEDCMRDEVLFAWAYDGEPLPEDHGGPLRVVTPHKYAYKGAKWVDGVEFLTEPELGYWERRGYSETANPWREERYS
ncbi:sulfite oxidase-like oxidoreductase [Natrialba taiwanensis]|uniref:Oxidoreductase molybdopterin binding protein n=1 Tax=Natrialba taiwanensis DSM 12281 TaxID=1230458 RepID=L9ZGD5_9EURY|nr:sulfite oxidase-like oxidoreductase [Natrialba taiwanensis]ELY85505.1 oxidoreductase molybdopterin binding protein [Natrialba taiwanensis DSM 12281]